MGTDAKAALDPTCPDHKAMLSLYALRSIYVRGIHLREEPITEELASAIALNDNGRRVKEAVLSRDSGFTDPEAAFGVFLALGHHEILLNVEETRVSALHEFINQSVVNGSLKFPYVFEHKLYDRAPSLAGDLADELTEEQTSALLKDTPAGIFQVGNYVTGPYGILESLESRCFWPRRKVLLGHCKNLLCSHEHESALSGLWTKPLRAWRQAMSYLIQTHGEADGALEDAKDAIEGDYYLDDLWIADLPSFLGDCFSERELMSVVVHLMEADSRLLSLCPVLLQERKTGRKKSDIWGKIQKPEAIQLILLARDADIVAAIDRLIEQRAIVIPESEVRFSPSKCTGTWQDIRCECSDLGFRVAARHSTLSPQARLKRLVLSLYDSPDQDDLLFELRKVTGATAPERLERLIATREPSYVLESFVFASRKALLRSLQHLRAAHMNLPDNDTEEEVFINRVLWKLGFPKTCFGSVLSAFHEKLGQFLEVVKTVASSEEKWREQVRSVGVNLFVIVEEVLDYSLAFCTWLFMADHVSEHLAFNWHRARVLTASELSGSISTDQGPVEYRANGKNTLFPLILMFEALRRRLESLLSEPADKHRKPANLMAWFSASSLQSFPFRHYHFAFDMSHAEVTRCLEIFEAVPKKLQRAPVMKVRNNLGHAADLFPSRSEVEECCMALKETLGELEKSGLIPIDYANVSVHLDGFRRERVVSKDYAGREITWFRSAALTCLHELPEIYEPQILVPSLTFPTTAEPLRFGIKEDSEFSRMWENYPRRRPKADGALNQIPPVDLLQ